jgi:hypothetical protein
MNDLLTDPKSITGMSQAPDSNFWLAVAGGAAGWVLAVERRLFNRVTRRELKDDLEEIKAHLRRQDIKRDELADAVHAVDKKVAIVQTRMGHPPTGDTGTFKR